MLLLLCNCVDQAVDHVVGMFSDALYSDVLTGCSLSIIWLCMGQGGRGCTKLHVLTTNEFYMTRLWYM